MIVKTISRMRMKRVLIGGCFLAVILILIFRTASADHRTDEQYRSTSLKEVVSQSGNVERIDYFNKEGTITEAADKNYATCIKTTNGISVLEEFFDAKGEPAKQPSGYYAILREFDENEHNYRITYLGRNHEPITITAGYSICLRQFNQDGLLVKEQYLDVDGNPTKTDLYGYGCLRNYDENGRVVLVTYINENGEPVVTRLGYATLRRTFYGEGSFAGKVENEFYFDAYEQPIALSHGEYGAHKEYDEYGREIGITYLAVDGNPMVTKDGYTTVKRTFYPNDTIRTEMYFDVVGNPVALSQGQYGELRKDGKVSFLTADGKELFNLKNYLYEHTSLVVVTGLFIVLISLICGRGLNFVLLVVFIGFIIYITLMNRTTTGKLNTELQPFWSYRQILTSPVLRLEILNNIWLFVPLGTILYKLHPKIWVMLLPIMFSVIIETIQLFTGIGLAEIDDMISNGLGGAIGYGIGFALAPLLRKGQQRS